MLNPLQIQRLLDIANAGCHTGNIVQARTVYEGILALKPGFVPARIGIALSHVVIDEFAEAEAILTEILDANPQDEDAQAMLGLTHTLNGQTNEARTFLMPLTSGKGPHAALATNLLSLI